MMNNNTSNIILRLSPVEQQPNLQKLAEADPPKEWRIISSVSTTNMRSFFDGYKALSFINDIAPGKMCLYLFYILVDSVDTEDHDLKSKKMLLFDPTKAQAQFGKTMKAIVTITRDNI